MSAATEQASALGLSTVAMSIAPQTERVQAAAAALDLPDNLVPHIMIAVSHPATDADSSSSVAFYNQNKVHCEQFAGQVQSADKF